MIHDTLRDMLDIDDLAYPQLRFMVSRTKSTVFHDIHAISHVKRRFLFNYVLNGLIVKGIKACNDIMSGEMPVLSFICKYTITKNITTNERWVSIMNGESLKLRDTIQVKQLIRLCGYVDPDRCGRNKAKLRHLVWYECDDEIPLNGE